MQNLVLINRNNDFAEIVNDFDFNSFKYEYEKNGDRSISLTAFKTSLNADIFDSLLNENYLMWKDQMYVIKSTELKYENSIITNDIVAKHISMEFQNHYIDKDLNDESLNEEADDSEEETKPTMKASEYLDIAFKNNKQDFDYELHGKFNKRVEVEQIGEKNGLEFVVEGAELFGYIFLADNKTFHIYTPEEFYKPSDEVLIYKYNNSSVNAKTTTTELKTYIQGYGKKKSKAETKNYKPVKPKDLNYNGSFIKEKTWRTENVGDSYSKKLKCKWGNETLTWSLKKMSKGGMIEVFVDGQSKGKFSCYSKNAETEKIVIATGLKKGEHTFKAVFKGPKDKVDYKKSKPAMYVGTSKSDVLNLTAVLKGKDIYHTHAEYKSEYYESFGRSEAPTVYDDSITSKSELEKKLKEELTDEPIVEVETNYLGLEQLHENNTIRFIHKPLGFNVDLKVVKLTEPHPFVKEPIEVEFSNAKTDIVKLQQQLNKRIKNVNNSIKKGDKINYSKDIDEVLDSYSDDVGSVLVDD